LQCAPKDMLGVMESESSVRPDAQNPNGKATGLIQFMPSTLTGLGWTDGPDAFRQLTAEQQLPFVKRYFAPHVVRGLGSAGQLYQATFLPATLPGSSEETVMAAPGGPNASAYTANRLLDTNRDGKITVSDLTARINNVRQGDRWNALTARLDASP
jgi:Transglycosylase SLT domain